MRCLGHLALISHRRNSDVFAQSIEELRVDDATGFAQLIDRMPYPQGIVPLRRTLRLLAAGSGCDVMATSIRSLFWHRD